MASIEPRAVVQCSDHVLSSAHDPVQVFVLVFPRQAVDLSHLATQSYFKEGTDAVIEEVHPIDDVYDQLEHPKQK